MRTAVCGLKGGLFSVPIHFSVNTLLVAAERDPLLPHVLLFKAQGHVQHEHAIHVVAGSGVCACVCLTGFSLVFSFLHGETTLNCHVKKNSLTMILTSSSI